MWDKLKYIIGGLLIIILTIYMIFVYAGFFVALYLSLGVR